MVDERQHRVKPEPALEVRSYSFLLRMRTDQCGIQINHHLTHDRDRRMVALAGRSMALASPRVVSTARARQLWVAASIPSGEVPVISTTPECGC